MVAVHVDADSSAASRGVVVCMMAMFRGESNDGEMITIEPGRRGLEWILR
jgi:hypothetical protein